MLPLPGLAIVRNQPVSEEGFPHLLDIVRLVEVGPVRDVDPVDDRRITDEKQVAKKRAGHEDVAMLFVLLDEKARTILDHLHQAAPKPMAASARDRPGRHRARRRRNGGLDSHTINPSLDLLASL